MRKPRKKPCRVGENKSKIVSALPRACSDEREAVEFMERQRWGDGPACVKCGDLNVYAMTDRKTGERNKRFLWRCRGCGTQYTVRLGTVFEDSPIPLRMWCYAFWKACSSKKGVSALQICRETGLSYKSALFMMHRVRWAMAPAAHVEKLTGTLEVDETYVGGKPRKRAGPQPYVPRTLVERHGMKRHVGRGTPKTPVVAIIQREGEVRARIVPDVTAKNLRSAIRQYVEPTARIITDEFTVYQGLDREFSGGHETVTHSRHEYARGDVHVNTAEAFFALIKRCIMGTFHNVSKKHLHRYVSQFSFRWNTRKVDDGERTLAAIRGAEGRRLMYAQPTGA